VRGVARLQGLMADREEAKTSGAFLALRTRRAPRPEVDAELGDGRPDATRSLRGDEAEHRVGKGRPTCLQRADEVGGDVDAHAGCGAARVEVIGVEAKTRACPAEARRRTN
jgi:hypothetical protein